jgi:AcrR family transcriptional regulator
VSKKDSAALRGKQKEIQAREGHFIQAAREILFEEGYQGVSISRVAEATRFSKGTVYQIFRSKEELVTALGIQCRAKLLETVRKAADFSGRPRERMVALGEAMAWYSKYCADDQRILKLIDAETILERVPVDQQESMKEYDVQMFLTLLGIVRDAISEGDLVLRDDSTPQSLSFAFWTMIDGCFAASMGGAPLQEAGISEPMREVVQSAHYLMDGYGWRPLHHEWDYEATARSVRALLSSESQGNVRMTAAGRRDWLRSVGSGA